MLILMRKIYKNIQKCTHTCTWPCMHWLQRTRTLWFEVHNYSTRESRSCKSIRVACLWYSKFVQRQSNNNAISAHNCAALLKLARASMACVSVCLCRWACSYWPRLKWTCANCSLYFWAYHHIVVVVVVVHLLTCNNAAIKFVLCAISLFD